MPFVGSADRWKAGISLFQAGKQHHAPLNANTRLGGKPERSRNALSTPSSGAVRVGKKSRDEKIGGWLSICSRSQSEKILAKGYGYGSVLSMDSPRRSSKTAGKTLTLGLAGFAKISAIEGVRLSSDSRRMFEEFDRKGLNAEQRRKAIAAKHARKA